MYDPYQKQVVKELDFKTLDFRNGVYQGEVHSRPLTREGFGIALDHNFLLALGNWRKNLLNGESFIIFPDQSQFYGNIMNSLPSQFCCYHTISNFYVFSVFNDKGDNSFAFDNPLSKSLRKIQLSANLMNKLLNQAAIDDDFLLEEYKKSNSSQEIVIMDQQRYENNSQKWRLLQDMLKTKISQQQKTFQSYLEASATKNKKVVNKQLQLIQKKQYFQFSFQQSAIRCRFVSSPQTNIRKLKILGFFQFSSNHFTVSKSYNYDNGTIQQNIEGKSIVYTSVPMRRPIQCLTLLHKYYKKSLNFVNQYLGIDYLYRIKFIFSAFEKLFQLLKEKNADFKLFEVGSSQIDEKLKDSVIRKTQDLQVIKEQIYYMAKKRHSSKEKRFLNSPPKRSKSTGLTTYRSKSAQQAHYRRVGTITSSRINNFQQLSKKIKNRSSVYLQQQSKQLKYGSKEVESKKRKTEKKGKKRQFQGFLSKFAYLEEDSREINQKKIQNIKTLTERYQQIQKQLKKGGYTAPDLKEKDKKCIDSKEISSSITRKTFNKQKNQPLFMGPKKILKYNWD